MDDKPHDPNRILLFAIENEQGHPEIISAIPLEVYGLYYGREGIHDTVGEEQWWLRVYEPSRDRLLTVPFDSIKWHHRP